MKAGIALMSVGAFAVLVAPFRRLRKARLAQPARLDAATYATMLAEAERIASPFKRHVHRQVADLSRTAEDDCGDDFPEVAALLERAGICV